MHIKKRFLKYRVIPDYKTKNNMIRKVCIALAV